MTPLDEPGSDALLGADGLDHARELYDHDREAEREEDARTEAAVPSDDGLPDAPVD